MEKLFEIAYELKDLLNKDERILALNDIEEQLSSSHEVMSLSYKKDVAVDNYSDALKHFSEDSNEVKQAQKDLYLAKKNLDEYPMVKEYLDKYKVVRELYDYINNSLFSILNINLCMEK